jgi:hypothetical protein
MTKLYFYATEQFQLSFITFMQTHIMELSFYVGALKGALLTRGV